MKLSTMGRYGLRIMMDIAVHQKDGAVTLHAIAERQELSQKYLWHVITPMKHYGLIQVTRGVGGGYRLARPAKDISLFEIVTAVEGHICIVPCVHSASPCKRAPSCPAKKAWEAVNDVISNALKGMTLDSIMGM